MELELLEAHPAPGAEPAAPLLFVHGAWHGAWCWERVLPFVAARGHDAYAVSLRGHGRSPLRRSLRLTTLGDYVEDVAAAVARVGRDPILVGHSMGALVVQRYLAGGGRAAGAVLLAPVPRSGALATTLRFAARHPLAFLEVNLTWSLWPALRTPALARELLLSETFSAEEVRVIHARLQDESYLAYLGMLLPRLDPSRVRVPVRVVGAGADGLFGAEEIRAAARGHGVEAEIVPGAAHDLMLDPRWEEVAAGIVTWARGLSASSAARADPPPSRLSSSAVGGAGLGT
jgi:pimeloyl-ACP methyl ester carboxylesterase